MPNGDIRGATRLLTTDETLAPIAPEALAEMKKKHPVPSARRARGKLTSSQSVTVTQEEVIRAIKSFSKR